MGHTDNERYILSSVDNALSILNLFLKEEELSTTEIAKQMEISRSTAFRFIVTLENRGFLQKTDSGKYRLGLNIFSLGMMAHNRMEIVRIVRPYLERMAQETGESCHIAIIEDDSEVVFLDRAIGTHSLKMDTPLGYRMKAHNTATGKAILAFQDEKTITRYLRKASFEKNTENSIADVQQLMQILEKVRKNGYAADNEEAEYGLTCLARPLRHNDNTPFAAISVSGPTTRIMEQKDFILRQLEICVSEILENL